MGKVKSHGEHCAICEEWFWPVHDSIICFKCEDRSAEIVADLMADPVDHEYIEADMLRDREIDDKLTGDW